MKQIQSVRLSLIGIVLLIMSNLMSAQSEYSDRDHWVDSIFNQMTDNIVNILVKWTGHFKYPEI